MSRQCWSKVLLALAWLSGAAKLPAITLDGLILDLNADLGVTSDGDGVSEWQNQAASGGDDFMQPDVGKRPSLLSGVVNGHDAIDLNGHQDTLVGDDDTAFDGLIQGEGYTWLAVVRVPDQTIGNTGNNKFAVFGTLDNSSPFAGVSGGVRGDETPMTLTRPSGEVVVGGTTILSDGQFHIIGGRLAAGTGSQLAEVFADGPVAQASNNVTILDTSQAGPIALAMERTGSGGGQAFDGDLARLLIYDRPLTDEELNETGVDLASIYGIATAFTGSSSFSLEVTSSGDDLVFTWDSQPGKVYDLLSSVDPEADGDPATWTEVAGQQDIPATPDTNTRTIVRPNDATRLYVIREENAPPPPPVFFDDFESVPNPDWTIGTNGGDAGTTVWERGSPINVGPTSGYDDSATCFGTNISSDYTLNTDIWLRTPPIDLTGDGITGATLSFWQHRDTDFDGQDDDDYGTIRVLDANSFAQLGDPIATGIEGFDFDGENNPVWVEFEAVSLPAEALGKEVVLEFRFKSDDLAAIFAGWYIDDVKVEVE